MQLLRLPGVASKISSIYDHTSIITYIHVYIICTYVRSMTKAIEGKYMCLQDILLYILVFIHGHTLGCARHWYARQLCPHMSCRLIKSR